MARRESARDDLFEELSASHCRWELQTRNGLVTAAIRPQDRFSCYFDDDPCFHFDASHRLQRAFLQGELYRTQGATLARLRRVRTKSETQLLRTDLSQTELESFVTGMHERLAILRNSLQAADSVLLRASSHDGPVPSLSLLEVRLTKCLTADPVLAPAYATRRK